MKEERVALSLAFHAGNGTFTAGYFLKILLARLTYRRVALQSGEHGIQLTMLLCPYPWRLFSIKNSQHLPAVGSAQQDFSQHLCHARMPRCNILEIRSSIPERYVPPLSLCLDYYGCLPVCIMDIYPSAKPRGVTDHLPIEIYLPVAIFLDCLFDSDRHGRASTVI